MSDREEDRKNLVSAAGRTAFAILRTTGRRAKLGGLHLPIALHPHRHEAIALPEQTAREEARPPVGEADAALPASTPLFTAEVRALRSKLAAAERRNSRLRYALRQQRLAIARAEEARRQPRALIDHLVSDLAGLGSADTDEIRRAVTSVLAAYGFDIPTTEEQPVVAVQASIAGYDRRQLATLIEQVLASQPEIGGARYVQLTLEALGRHGALSLQQLGTTTGLTSPMARRRLRLTVEALCGAGAAQLQGSRYCLVPNPPRSAKQ